MYECIDGLREAVSLLQTMTVYILGELYMLGMLVYDSCHPSHLCAAHLRLHGSTHSIKVEKHGEEMKLSQACRGCEECGASCGGNSAAVIMT